MTPEQIELARHALGLDDRRKQSYRNRFCAGPGHDDYAAWVAMVADGNAEQHKSKLYAGDSMFFLTKAGATAALRPGETLDPEDFP